MSFHVRHIYYCLYLCTLSARIKKINLLKKFVAKNNCKNRSKRKCIEFLELFYYLLLECSCLVFTIYY